jgi:hypothetical protein
LKSLTQYLKSCRCSTGASFDERAPALPTKAWPVFLLWFRESNTRFNVNINVLLRSRIAYYKGDWLSKYSCKTRLTLRAPRELPTGAPARGLTVIRCASILCGECSPLRNASGSSGLSYLMGVRVLGFDLGLLVRDAIVTRCRLGVDSREDGRNAGLTYGDPPRRLSSLPTNGSKDDTLTVSTLSSTRIRWPLMASRPICIDGTSLRPGMLITIFSIITYLSPMNYSNFHFVYS